MRADAKDNRSRILAAADIVFGRDGASASTEEVATRAGVGIATVFRHFPTKLDLLGAVLTLRLEQLRDRARTLLEAADAGAAFTIFFTEVVASAPSKLAIIEALTGTERQTGKPGAGETGRAGEELRRAFGDLFRRAQREGNLRADARAGPAYALMIGVSRAAALEGVDARMREGMLKIVFDGLKP